MTDRQKGSPLLTLIIIGLIVYALFFRGCDIGFGPGPGPGPDPGPGPSPDVILSEKVESWAREVGDPQGVRVISAVYGETNQRLVSNQISVGDVTQRLGQETDRRLETIGATARWSNFRSKLSDEVSLRMQMGNFGTKRQVSDFLVSVKYGVDASL